MTSSLSFRPSRRLLLLVLLCGAQQLLAQDTAFLYQGRLREGANAATGLYDFRFGLFGTNIGGLAVAPSLTNFAVEANAGLFTVQLDFGAAAFTGDNRWLEIGVRANGTSDFTTLAPRQPIESTPYAIQAANALNVADASITSAKLSSGPGTNGQVLKLNGGALAWANDNDTLYSAGAGLNLTGATFSVAFGGSGSLSQAARSDHKHAIGDLVTGILAVEQGGTGAGTVSNALVNLGGASLSQSNFFTGPNTLLNADNRFAGAFSGDGGGLTNLNVRTTIIASNDFALSFDPVHFAVTDGSNVSIRSGAMLASPVVASGTIAGDGSGLTNLDASQLATGVVPIERGGTGADTASNALVNLGGASLTGSNLFSGANTMVNPNNRFSGTFSGNGTFLLGVDAENLIGTLQSAQLAGTYSAPLRFSNPSNVFSGAFSGTGSDLTALNAENLSSGVVSISRGGTGAGTATAARASLGAAASGANSDITSLNGLTAPIPMNQGGTGANTPSDALANLNGASLTQSNLFSGVNVMGNSSNQFVGTFTGDGSGLVGLDAANMSTGVVSIARGGTGAATPTAARASLGAAASGTNSDITALNGLSAPIFVTQGGTGANSPSNALVNLGGASLTRSNRFAGANVMTNDANRFVGRFTGDGSNLTGLDPENFSSTVPVVRGGTSADTPTGARLNLGAAASGANRDITSLGGLTTPLSVSQGGSGATNAANALRNFGGASLTGSNLFSGVNSLLHPANQFAGTFNGNGSALNNVNASALAGLTPSSFWQLGGNPGTTVGSFLGTTDNQPLELRVNSVQALRLEPNPSGAPNVIAPGGVAIGTNTSAGRALFVNGSAALGGSNVLEIGAGVAGKHANAGKIGYQTFTPGSLDIVGAGSNAISRRIKFWAEGGATFNGTGTNPAVIVANTVDDAAAISLSAPFSTWRVGQNKPPDAPNAFDSFFVYQQSASRTRLLITDTGRVGLGTNNPTHPLHLANNAYCTVAGVWTSVSDRNAKQDFRAIQPREVLAKVAALPITEWKYKVETNGVKHLGPMAQDFHSAFGLGESDKTIGTVDADGVALAAIQGLHEIVEKQGAEISTLRRKNEQMESRLQMLEAIVQRMR